MQHLLLGAALRGAGTLLPQSLRDVVRAGVPGYLVPRQDRINVSIWVRCIEGGIEFSLDALPEAHEIETIALKPLPLVLEWREQNAPQSADIVLNPPRRTAIAVETDQVEVTVSDGTRYRITAARRNTSNSARIMTMLAELSRAETTHIRRAEVGERISRLGDPRRGVGVDRDGTPDIDWCAVPGRQVMIQGDRPALGTCPTFLLGAIGSRSRSIALFWTHRTVGAIRRFGAMTLFGMLRAESRHRYV